MFFFWVFAMGKKRSDSEKPKVLIRHTTFLHDQHLVNGENGEKKTTRKSQNPYWLLRMFLGFQAYAGW